MFTFLIEFIYAAIDRVNRMTGMKKDILAARRCLLSIL